MYRQTLNSRDRGGAMAAVLAIHAALGFAFLNLSGTIDLPDPQAALQVFDIRETQPPPPQPEPPPEPPPPAQRQAQPEKPKQREGASSPENLRSEATPVVAPTPRIPTAPPKIAVTETPRQGAGPTQGASDVRGPGTGAGGVGTGTGSGAGGSGPGGGGGGGGAGGYVEGPRLLTAPLRGRDFPRFLLDRWPRRAPIFLRLRIDAGGRAIQCIVDRGTGDAAIDSQVCNLVQTRLRYRPALNRNGQAVAGWTGYVQAPPR
jgi:protein TonB